jgi:hypothetical protein
VLRKISRLKREEVTEEWSKEHNEGFRGMYSSPKYVHYHINKDEIGETCGKQRREGKSAQGFGGERSTKEAKWMTCA